MPAKEQEHASVRPAGNDFYYLNGWLGKASLTKLSRRLEKAVSPTLLSFHEHWNSHHNAPTIGKSMIYQ